MDARTDMAEPTVKKKILVVDDEESMRVSLLDALRFEGFAVFGASDGEEGLQVALREKPNLILLDIIMPKMNGLLMAKKLRGDPWGKTVPIVVITNLNMDQQFIEHEVGTDPSNYLMKPNWTLDDIVKKACEVLEAHSPKVGVRE